MLGRLVPLLRRNAVFFPDTKGITKALRKIGA